MGQPNPELRPPASFPDSLPLRVHKVEYHHSLLASNASSKLLREDFQVALVSRYPLVGVVDSSCLSPVDD